MASPGGDNACFGFAFNDPKFSDRVLRVQVQVDSSVAKLGKRSREEAQEVDVSLAQHNLGLLASSSSSCKVTNIHINSLVLAAKSPVFHKMFSNGMKESELKYVTLSIHASEEESLLDLLRFLYSNKLAAKTACELFNVLMLADKYQIVSCIRYCGQLLQSLPMTLELAISCTDLPPTILAHDSIKKLVKTATTFVSEVEGDLSKHKEEALKLPLERLEIILSSDKLKVNTEDDVFDFALEWVKTRYEDQTERRKVFSSRICPLIRFPLMSCHKLKEAQRCTDLYEADATEMVLMALFTKVRHYRLPRARIETPCSERAYKFRHVKVTLLESPYPECIVYWNLRKEECETTLGGFAAIATQPFAFGNGAFCLKIKRMPKTKFASSKLRLYLHRLNKDSDADVNAECEFAVRLGSTHKYSKKCEEPFTFKAGIRCRSFDIFSWDSLMAEQSRYFINDVFHLRATFTIR